MKKYIKTARSAYAKQADNDFIAYKFKSKALRDFVISRVPELVPATSEYYNKVLRNDSTINTKRDKWGNKIYTEYSACDMDILEYWDEWDNILDEAYELGLM